MYLVLVCRYYLVVLCQVFYKTGENMTQLHWFVKIPRSLQTVAMDERELVMYNTIFPKLKTFIKDNLKPGKLPNIYLEGNIVDEGMQASRPVCPYPPSTSPASWGTASMTASSSRTSVPTATSRSTAEEKHVRTW